MKYFSITLLLALSSLSSFAGDSLKNLNDKAERASKILQFVSSEQEIPRAMIASANCVAAVTIHKAGMMGVGAKSGQGLATCRTENGWSNPSVLNVNGASVGPQIGIGKVNMVMVFVGDKAVQQLKSKNMTGDMQLSLVAGPVGREAMAGVDFKLENGIYSYAKAKGLYFGATLGAAMISPDKSSNGLLYKEVEDYNLAAILETPASDELPDAFKEFLNSLNELD